MEPSIQEGAAQLATLAQEWPLDIWLRRSFWIGGLVAAYIAVVGVLINAHQAKINAMQARARFLHELDTRWTRLIDIRAAVGDLKCRIERACLADPALAGGATNENLKKLYSAELSRLRGREPHMYAKVIQICDFFEFVGLMVEKGYVPLSDVVDLLMGPIDDFDTIFGDHIRERQNEPGVLPGLLGHALSLTQKARSGP